jgi:hypothetical protein
MQAAAYIEASGSTVQEYQLRLKDYKELAIEHSSNSSGGKLQGSSIKDQVAAALFLSVDQIIYNNAFAADYLLLAACVD